MNVPDHLPIGFRLLHMISQLREWLYYREVIPKLYYKDILQKIDFNQKFYQGCQTFAWILKDVSQRETSRWK